MKRSMFFALSIGLLLALSPAPASASGHDAPDPRWATKTLDVAIVRPVSLVVSLVSTGLFLGTLPLTFPTGVGDESAYLLVAAPWRYTAGRYLGDFRHYQDGRDLFGRVPAGAQATGRYY